MPAVSTEIGEWGEGNINIIYVLVLAASGKHFSKAFQKSTIVKSSQVKYINTDKHILRFAKNNRTAARKAFCLIVICVSCSSGF